MIAKSFVALFLIINPIGLVPIFISLLDKFGENERKLIIRKATFIATVTLIIFTFTGKLIFKSLGVNMYSFKIAGGILLLIISIEMLFGKTHVEVSPGKIERENITITPLAIPLLTGPGAITTGIVLFDSTETLLDVFILLLIIPLIFILSYFILSRYHLVYKIFRDTGVKVIVRVMGLMLTTIAIQLILSGISEAFTIPLV